MRLLKQSVDTGLFSLTTFDNNDCPAYAILSHTWAQDDSEVTFEDVDHGTGQRKSGYDKLRFCARQARSDKLDYFWIDTCCIKKSDAAELSEAITSMFKWYSQSAKCYVLLTDVTDDKKLSSQGIPSWLQQFYLSRHHTRGWTLQEILAPRDVQFFSKEGNLLGDRRNLAREIEDATTIPVQALTEKALNSFSIAERMRWSQGRQTKKEEDRAYCLLGPFGVSLVPNYGEGIESAVRRLSNELAQRFREEVHDAGRTLTEVVQKGIEHDTRNLSIDERNTQWKNNRQRRNLHDRLKPENLNARRQNVRDAQPNTCEWFFKHPAVITWDQRDRMHNHHGFLWLLGNRKLPCNSERLFQAAILSRMFHWT
jgi:hypothetical protein